MRRFQAIKRKEVYLRPPSIQDWLPKPHLARFVVDFVDQLDLVDIERATYDSVAFGFIAGDAHPDHDTPNTFCSAFSMKYSVTCCKYASSPAPWAYSSYVTSP